MLHYGQRQFLLTLLKALADEQRLTMVNLLSTRAYTVTELAGVLGLTEPTISHHVSKLHSAGLLRLRMAGNQRFYQINEARLAQFKALIADIEKLPTAPETESADYSWMETLKLSADDKKVLREYTHAGKLTQLPTKEKKWLVVLRWLATLFEPGVYYSEKQVNAMLTAIHEDYATLRRSLVEYGFMRRERGGGNYWLAPDQEQG
ncbi:MAG: metalloregulator ArsR/SmtB family transcription factor [Chloroflexi bacterium]|nr:metalloregulator ArsR/SmtB family transcription factor [Chloroflexota bacterium]